MNKILILPLFLFYSFFSHSQLDYLKMKDTICPAVCGIRDSSEVVRIYNALLNLDTTKISFGMALYYDDLSYFQYDLSLRNNEDSTLMRMHIQSAEKSLYHDPNNEHMIWSAASGYAGFRECERTHYYLWRYYEVCPKKFWRQKDKKEQIAILLLFCPDAELKKKFKIRENTIRN